MLARGKKEEIVAKIKERGYEVLEEKTIKFTPEMAKEFYSHKQEKEHFNDIIKYVTSGDSCVLALTKPDNKDDVVNSWRQEIGPKDLNEAKKQYPDSFRAQYANSRLMNAIHGSDSHEIAIK